MTRIIRNILIAFGAYYLSLWTAPLFSWCFNGLSRHFSYTSESLLSAVMYGVVTSMGRAVSAILAAAIVGVSADSETPERWAYVVALLYVVDASLRYHWKWKVPPTLSDHLWLGVDRFFPTIACVIGTIVIAHYQRKRASS